MTLEEAVKQGLITEAEVEWAYDPCDWVGFECLKHMEYDPEMFEMQRQHEREEMMARNAEEAAVRRYLEEAEEYADEWFEGV